MFYYDINNLRVVPLDFNLFVHQLETTHTVESYGDNIIDKKAIKRIYELIKTTGPERNVVVDLMNTNLLDRIEEDFSEFVNVAFVNAPNQVAKVLKSEIKTLETYENGMLSSKECQLTADDMSIVETYRTRICSEIIKKVGKPGAHFLESAGVYSNYFVDIKKLFDSSEQGVCDYTFLAFSLAPKVKEAIYKHSIDAFVAASRNGSIIASLLASMIGIKEIHLIGIGPKYAMQVGDSLSCVREGKSYAYIFDVLCTGTELKIVSALINSKKARLPYAAGFFKYETGNKITLVENLDTLTDSQKAGINYGIAGTKSELEGKNNG